MQIQQLDIPLAVRLRLGRAAAQVVAELAGADILHIKGEAIDPVLRPVDRSGTDVDILVRPSHVAQLDAALREHDWRVYSTFAYGSPFGHAQTYFHELWGYLDLHRFFPGIEAHPATAFDTLWAARMRCDIAGVMGFVPEVAAQAAILILNDARALPAGGISKVWADSGAERRASITDIVTEINAEVAFAAATGELERWRSARSYALWKIITSGGSRAAEWRARIRAAPSAWEAVRIAARAPAVNVEHLAHRLDRAPTRREIVREFFTRPLKAFRQAMKARKSGR